MSELFSFARFLRDRSDWSAGQRAKLERLADTLALSGMNVEVVFGKTDAGDPWCGVKGDDEEVLLHVARVDGRFVVHSLLEGTIEEASDLDTLLRARLDAGTDGGAGRQGEVVLPFETRRAQTLLALAVVVGAFESAPSRAEAAPQASGVEPTEAPPSEQSSAADLHLGPVVTLQPHAAPVHDRPPAATATSAARAEAPATLAANHVDPAGVAPIHSAAPELSAAAGAGSAQSLTPLCAPPIAPDLRGTAGADSLVGSARAEWIVGGAGNDTLVGGGGKDTLDGGDGDDRLVFTDGALASGGRGADTFVVEAPSHANPNQLLGVILDFSPAEGDRVITSRGRLLKFKSDGEGVSATMPSDEHRPTFHTSDAHRTVTRVEVDVDDDGSVDGYLLVITRTDPDNQLAANPGVQVLGHDVGASALLLDVTGDGVADGRLAIDLDSGPALLVVGRSLFSPGPFGAD